MDVNTLFKSGFVSPITQPPLKKGGSPLLKVRKGGPPFNGGCWFTKYTLAQKSKRKKTLCIQHFFRSPRSAIIYRSRPVKNHYRTGAYCSCHACTGSSLGRIRIATLMIFVVVRRSKPYRYRCDRRSYRYSYQFVGEIERNVVFIWII